MNVPAQIVYYYPSKYIYIVFYIPTNLPVVPPNISDQRGGLNSPKSPHLPLCRHGGTGPRIHTSIEKPLGLCFKISVLSQKRSIIMSIW